MSIITHPNTATSQTSRLTELVRIATKYTEAGFGVIPIRERGKAPRSNTLVYSSPLRTPDDVLRALPFHGEHQNLGVVPQHHLVVDIDLDVEVGKDGYASLATLEDNIGILPETATVTTGRGGKHLYYLLPDGFADNLAFNLTTYPGIDFISTKRHVIAPPSIHKNGTPYAFAPGHELGKIEIAIAPTPLLHLLSRGPTRPTSRKTPKSGRHSIAPTSSPDGADMNVVQLGCAFVAEQVGKEMIDEESWYAMAGISAHAEGGRDWFHQISSNDPRYNEAETNAKLDHAFAACRLHGARRRSALRGSAEACLLSARQRTRHGAARGGTHRALPVPPVMDRRRRSPAPRTARHQQGRGPSRPQARHCLRTTWRNP